MLSRQYSAPSEQEIIEALSFIDANCDRAQWARMGMAVKSELGEAGFPIWDEWSQSGGSYDKSSARSTWRSIKQFGSGGSVGVGTLFSQARLEGWTPSVKALDPEEKERREALLKARRKRREEEELRQQEIDTRWQEVYAQFFGRIWQEYFGSFGGSKYLASKQVDCFGLAFPRDSFVIVTDVISQTVWEITGRQAVSDFFKNPVFKDRERFAVRFIKRGVLLVPLRDMDGNIYNAQVIYPSGKKSFFREAPKAGLFHLIGELSNEKPCLVCEGYATGASLHKASGWPCFVAFDVHNLKPVVKKALSLVTPEQLIICGDDDVMTKGNPGRSVATKISEEVGCRVVFPSFEVSN